VDEEPTLRDGMRASRVVVTGSECTGKTTLAARLARRFEVPWSREYARILQEAKPSRLDALDVEPIARGQIALEDRARAEAGAALVVHDTDLVSTQIYARHYYGACPGWVEQAVRERRADLYLLCFPDVPWVADGLLRDSPHLREHIHGRFVLTLRELGARVVDITGPWAEREAVAIRAVERLLEARDTAEPPRL
jgi:NadR type nicotinamide-nucleotide adenylyltransferase